VLDDRSWVARAGPVPLQLGLATFGILALELALIRWVSGQVRVFAYFNNLVLIGAFLGMGMGVAIGRRRPGLVHLTLPGLFVLATVFAAAEPLGIMHLQFPDPTIHLWGGEGQGTDLGLLVRNLTIFLGLFVGLVTVFIFAGGAVGHLFPQLPALRAYGWDLGGSLLGILAFTAVTFLRGSPPVWIALGGLPFLWLSRRPLSLVALVGAVGLAGWSVDGAAFSPYNRIDLVQEDTSIQLSVNRDFHQYMHDLSDDRMDLAKAEGAESEHLIRYRAAYDLPFSINDQRERVLIVGAGTGNDAQAALRQGYQEVLSVDIDPAIIALGQALHPEQPYSDPRVQPIVQDARAFFEHYEGPPLDAVVYGLLDSHAMFTSLSSLRLDNYVYTEEGIRTAWEHVGPGGHLSLSFSVFGGRWLADRMYWTIARATDSEPTVLCHGMHFGCTFIVPRDGASVRFERVANFESMEPSLPAAGVRTTSDDWPFLYIKPAQFPWGYVLVLTAILVLALVGTPMAFGRQVLGSRFDPVLFFMGAGFLLLETRGVTSLSLLFGSTWLVNSAIFAGILVLVLLANLAVLARGLVRPEPWAALLLLSLVGLWFWDPASLVGLPLGMRGILGGLTHALPIGFAGVIVSILLARSSDPTYALGSNLLGAVLGGCLEYLSMVVGLRALVLLALMLYLLAALSYMRRPAAPKIDSPLAPTAPSP